MSNDSAAGYARRVLLAVTGLSAQVVTETLYALTVMSDPPWVPTEVHLLTTERGAENARLKLLSHQPGWFHRLTRDYGLPPIRFDAERVHVIHGEEGQSLADIRDDQDNRAAADYVADWVRRLTADDGCAVHASIAGGRKTMGFYLGYAMSLYGRPQDRLSHVLVSPPFESHPEFYYPTPDTHVITTLDRAQDALDTKTARVWLGDIPFVRLRDGVPAALLRGQTKFSETVDALNLVFAAPELVLDLHGRRIRAAGRVITLPPAELALLALFARRAQRSDPPLAAPPKGAGDEQWAAAYLALRREIGGDWADLDAVKRAMRTGMTGEQFSSCKSRLHSKLRAGLGHSVTPYEISDDRRRPRRYQLALAPEQIRFATSEDGFQDAASLPERPKHSVGSKIGHQQGADP